MNSSFKSSSESKFWTHLIFQVKSWAQTRLVDTILQKDDPFLPSRLDPEVLNILVNLPSLVSMHLLD